MGRRALRAAGAEAPPRRFPPSRTVRRVFGSPTAIGDNVMLTVATSDFLVGPTRILFPRLAGGTGACAAVALRMRSARARLPGPSLPRPFLPSCLPLQPTSETPISKPSEKPSPRPTHTTHTRAGEAADFPFSLLGLGDIAVPGLLACLALRYDASRSTDMRSRARAAVEAITSALDGLAPGSSSQAAANAASSAAELAVDAFADREARQRLDSLDGTNSGGNSASGGEEARLPVSDAVLHQRAYFTPVMLAYIGGLALAFTANAVTGLGQPALLYLVPCTLGAVVATAASRGELGRVWSYTDVASFGAGIGGGKEEEGEGKEAKP